MQDVLPQLVMLCEAYILFFERKPNVPAVEVMEMK